MPVQNHIGDEFGKCIGSPWDMCESNDIKLSYEEAHIIHYLTRRQLVGNICAHVNTYAKMERLQKRSSVMVMIVTDFKWSSPNPLMVTIYEIFSINDLGDIFF